MQFLPPKWVRNSFIVVFFIFAFGDLLNTFVRYRFLDWEPALLTGAVAVGVVLFFRSLALPWFSRAESWREQWRELKRWRKAGIWGVVTGISVYALLIVFALFADSDPCRLERSTRDLVPCLLMGTFEPIQRVADLLHRHLAPALGMESLGDFMGPSYPNLFVKWVLSVVSWSLLVAYWFGLGVLAFTASRLLALPIRRLQRA